MSGGGGTLMRPHVRGLRWLPTRIRSKLIFLHTLFSLALAAGLLLVLRSPIREIMHEAEALEAQLAIELYLASPQAIERFADSDIEVLAGEAERFGLEAELVAAARNEPSRSFIIRESDAPLRAVRFDEPRNRFIVASVRIVEARAAVDRLYILFTIAMLAVYALIALTLEVFVLPRQVYEPISILRRADEAVQRGERDREIIAEPLIPFDEIGEIMRSRNQSITKLRHQERELERALTQLEETASELRRKNHLLETARRNLADADRLASLGMMSAGIAHELNTPLVVLKGIAEEVAASGRTGITPERAALMLRVVKRLERLSESLLDFARVRPPAAEPVHLREVIEEAWTLVRLDRSATQIELENLLSVDLAVLGDGDRLTQVFVNLLRNSADAIEGPGRIRIESHEAERDGTNWVSILIADNGPGIDPTVLSRLFEPFQSTRLDSHGTGLGLAVAEGIVREHGGLILARNAEAGGAVFEVMLPRQLANDVRSVSAATLSRSSATSPLPGVSDA